MGLTQCNSGVLMVVAVLLALIHGSEAFQALHAGHLLPEVTPAERDTTPGRRLRVRTSRA
jgi:hypothetical protein